MITATNPATGKTIDSYSELSKKQVIECIEKADAVFQQWKTNHIDFRASQMIRAGAILRENTEKYARLITKEMGKPIKESRSEIEKCAWVCEYYAENASSFLAKEEILTDASKSYISYQPLGVVLAVMPWNFPFWQVFRFAAPALMAGNAALLKHASNVPGCAKAIQSIFEEAGFPKHLFTTLIIDTDLVETVMEHNLVKAVTLTGSGGAGSAVAATAGKQIKKTVLELGGSDAYLILEDADINEAVKECAKSRLLNTGQSCIGAKRFVVVEAVYDQFLEAFKKEMEAAKMGNPMEEDTDLGSMARTDLRDELHEQVQKSIDKGANCILGGTIPDRQGAYYPATILTEVAKGMPAYEEELFGPVASVIRAKDQADAVRIANDNQYGLGAAVFTKDVKNGEYIANELIEAGSCFVNGMVKSDPRLPFGGIKASGYGRELSYLGIREFTNIKTVWVK